MSKLEDKIALVTGGNGGIGLATALQFVEDGAYVFITGRRQSELDEAVKQIGKNVTGVQGDVTKLADLDRLFATIKEQRGHLDIVFANAGVAAVMPFENVTEEEFDRQFDINVKGTFFTVQKALPLLRDGASVILNASIVGSKGYPMVSVYSATKAALRSFARTWTTELKSRRIRVNVVSPGPVRTPGFKDINGTGSEEAIEASAQGIPLGRVGKPDDIAKAVSFLASDDSSFITGIELFVDGGMVQV